MGTVDSVLVSVTLNEYVHVIDEEFWLGVNHTLTLLENVLLTVFEADNDEVCEILADPIMLLSVVVSDALSVVD